MRRFLLATTFLTLATAAQAQSWQSATVNGMTYEVLLPPNYNPATAYPAVLFLHQLDMGADWAGGDGGLEGEFTADFQAMQAQHPSIVVVPLLDQSADPSGQTINFGGVTGSTTGEANAVTALEQVQATYNVNKSQVYVTGASMGGQGTDQMMVDYGPNSSDPIFAAGLSMAGTMINMSPAAAAAALGNAPIIAVHGSDDGTNLPGWDEQMAQIDPNFQLTLVQGAGHDIWDGSSGYSNPALWGQLFSNTLGGATSTSAAKTTPAITLASTSTPVPTAAGSPAAPVKPTVAAATPANTAPAASTPAASGAAAPTPAADTKLAEQEIAVAESLSAEETPNTPLIEALLSDATTQLVASQQSQAAPTPVAATQPPATKAAASTPTVMTLASGAPVTTCAATAGGAATGSFTTANGQILDPSGKVFIARGVNVGPNTMGQASAQTLQSLFPGINFVRFATGYQSSTMAAEEDYAKSLTAAGIVIEIEDHPYPSPGVYSGAQLQAESAWYAQWASDFKGNPAVMFGTMNEPGAGTSPGAISDQELATYNAIRGAGSNAILFLELYGGGNPGTIGIPGGMSQQDYSNMTNVAWDLHFYGWAVNMSTDQATINAYLASAVQQAQTITGAGGSTIPVAILEFGNSTTGASMDPDGSQVVTGVQSSGNGYAAWTFGGSGGDIDNLTTGGSLTDYGQQVAGGIALIQGAPAAVWSTACGAAANVVAAQVAASEATPADAAQTPNADPGSSAAPLTVSVPGVVTGETLAQQAEAIARQ